MGEVTGSLCIGPDGTSAPRIAPEPPDAQVELLYAFGPELLPAAAAAPQDMWRYRALLPLGEGPVRYPLAVGGTPLIAAPALRAATGFGRLWLKDETRGPSGSNKDRATALVIEQALRAGANTVTCASTGNVATSLAIGAAAAGLRAVVFVPAGVAPGKLTAMLAAGARVFRVREGYTAAFRLSREAARAFGWHERNTGVNPGTVEAKKTVAFEIWEQLGRRLPDAVVAPVGDGPTLYALGKGFRELVACGAGGPLPRLIGVQAAGCQPVTRAWETGETVRAQPGQTLADGIAVEAPVSGGAVLREVRESGGGMVAVEDAALLRAIDLLARSAGLLAEPAGAAATAGLAAAAAAGLVRPGERVVALVTGTGLKTPQFLPATRDAPEIGADLAEVQRALPQ